MVHQVQPVGLMATELIFKTLILYDLDCDQIVGMPDTLAIDVQPSAPTTTASAGDVEQYIQVPKEGDCVEVCGAKDCDYLFAMPGLGDHGLSLSEHVYRDVIGDVDDFSVQKASWELAPEGKCGASPNRLRKRQWYAEYEPEAFEYDQEFDPYPYPDDEQYIHQDQYQQASYPLQSQYQQLPGPTKNAYHSRFQNVPAYSHKPQAQQAERNVKISNNNPVGAEEESERATFSALTEPSRRTVGPASPASKQNLSKGTARRFPIDLQKVPTQSSVSESYSLDPTISFNSASPPIEQHQQEVDPYYAPEHAPEYAHAPETAVAISQQPQAQAVAVAVEDPSAPRIKKTEHPDGSIEYSFGVTSGEFSVYNEGDPVRKPGQKQKSVISGLKASLGIDDEVSRVGWTRKVKRSIVPENRPYAKNVAEMSISDGDVFLKEGRRSQSDKADFMKDNKTPFLAAAKPAPKQDQQVRKQQPQSQPQSQPQPQPQPQAQAAPPPPEEEGSEEAEAAAEQAILDLQKLESDRLKRLSIKKFYRDMAAQGETIEVSRDKLAEQKISEESERIAAENAQARREERARNLKEKEPKADT